MNEIERLIKKGHLKNFIKKDGGPSSRPKEREELIMMGLMVPST